MLNSTSNQGMRFMWAFNHERPRAHSPGAAQLDPQLRICLWGVALDRRPQQTCYDG